MSTQTNKHAVLSPSGSEKWMTCPGSVVLEAYHPEDSSSFADEGTAAHLVHSSCLENNLPAVHFLSCVVVVRNGVASWWDYCPGDLPSNTEDTRYFRVDDEMATEVQKSLDMVATIAGEDAIIHAEQRLSLTEITGEEDAFGTADVVAIVGDEIQVHDLKYGKGIKVFAENNKQLLIYALAAYAAWGEFSGFKTVRVAIHQPRLNHHTEHVITVDELLTFGEVVKAKAAIALPLYEKGILEDESVWVEHLQPGEHCHDNFCKARADCPALRQYALDTADDAACVNEVTMNNSTLGSVAERIPTARKYFDLVMAKVEAKVLSGETVPFFKAVMGNKGNRKWIDEEGAIKKLAILGVPTDTIQPRVLISPTKAFELGLGKAADKALEEFIGRAEAKPVVVPVTDKRPAIEVKPESDFENLNTENAE